MPFTKHISAFAFKNSAYLLLDDTEEATEPTLSDPFCSGDRLIADEEAGRLPDREKACWAD
jgi:hypothetical protein